MVFWVKSGKEVYKVIKLKRNRRKIFENEKIRKGKLCYIYLKSKITKEDQHN